MDVVHIAILSLMITGIHCAFQDGNVLGSVRVWSANKLDKTLGKKWSRIVQKPLWDCLPCMASFWTIVLTFSVNIPLILAVCGLNVIIEKWLAEDELPENVPTLNRRDATPTR